MRRPVWTAIDPRVTAEHLGLIPMFLDEDNLARAADQLDAGYKHGGGWIPMRSWELVGESSIQYPGDKPLNPIAKTTLRDEEIFLYPHAWVAVIQPDRSFEVSRMD